MADRRKDKRASRLSVAISLVLHSVIIGALAFIAAREGMLGKDLKKIAVTMVPKEKPPEKPKAKEPEPKPEEAKPKVEEPKPVETPAPVEVAKPIAAPPPTLTGQSGGGAPAPAELPSFDFEGGKAVPIVNSASQLYRGYVEYALRSRWNRPEGIADENYVAEVELSVDPSGRILGSTWKKGSGDAAWDNSVKKAISETASIGRPPPKGFPDKVLVRFDVQPATEITLE